MGSLSHMWNPVHSSGPWAAALIASQGISNSPPSDFESKTVGVFWTKPWSLKWTLSLPSNSPVLGLYIRRVCKSAIESGKTEEEASSQHDVSINSDGKHLQHAVYIAQDDGRIFR